MKVADKNPGNGGRRDVGKNKLPLRPLAGIKEKPFAIPAKKIGAMISMASWLLAGTSKDC